MAGKDVRFKLVHMFRLVPLKMNFKGTPILGHAASVGAKYFAEDLGTDLMYMGEHDIFEVF